jgi:prepilin-type processing-associated H-X9-DG protein
MGWYWLNYTTDYSQNSSNHRDIVFCPSKPLNNTRLERDVLRSNYGVNLSICKSSTGRLAMAEFAGTPLSLADLPHPAQTLLIVDAGYGVIGWVHASVEPPFALTSRQGEDSAYLPGLSINRERTNLLPEQEYDAFNGRHPGKTVNVGFADGHISREKAESLLVEKTIDSYKNLSPLWNP